MYAFWKGGASDEAYKFGPYIFEYAEGNVGSEIRLFLRTLQMAPYFNDSKFEYLVFSIYL